VYKLHKYIFLVDYNSNECIAYNSLNGAIVMLAKSDIENNFINISNEDMLKLKELGMFLTNEECRINIEKTYLQGSSNELDIIIEFTKQCNLRCPYCYQGTWGRTGQISTETLDKLYEYIKKCCEYHNYSSVRLSLFGGEPLLQKNKIFYIYDKIKEFCYKKDIYLKTFLTTNALLLDETFLEHFDELTVSVTLSNKADHDKKRFVSSGSSFDIVYGNLHKVIHLFDFESRKLSIRFNTDHNNIDHFEELVIKTKKLQPAIVIDVAYLEEFESSVGYVNFLSLNDFRKWNSTTAIDILVKNGMCVDASPKIIRYPCHGYTGNNIKVFCDGRIGACDAFLPNNSNLTIQDICDNITSAKGLFGRQSLATTMKDCFNCKDFCLCGGKLFCKKKYCDYGLIDLHDFLKTYVKYSEMGYAELFSFTRTTKKE